MVICYGAEGGTRTRKPLRATDFKSVVYAIPPLRHGNVPFIASAQPFCCRLYSAAQDQSNSVRFDFLAS